MIDIPDDPVIRSMEKYGEPPWGSREPICPVCGTECSTIYKNALGEIVGCNECVETYDAVDVDECFPDMEDEW